MIDTERKAPETLSELAASLAQIAKLIDWVTNGLEEFPFTKQTDVLFARMSQTEVDGPLAAFHGFTYAWMVAKVPELDPPDAMPCLSIEDPDYRTYVVLRRNGHKLSLLLPRVFKYIDQEWAAKGEGE